MKRIKYVASLIALAVVVILFAVTFSLKGPVKVNNKFTAQSILYDVNNDETLDKIELFGKKNNVEGTFYSELNLSVEDGKTQMLRKSNLDYLSGSDPVLSAHDFTGDKLPEIFVSVISDNESKQLTSAIFDLKEDIIKNLFTTKDNRGIEINLEFGRDFVLNASFTGGQKFSINLEHIREALLSYGIYKENGEYSGNDTVIIMPYTSLIPIDYDGDSVFELCGTQQIITKNSKLPLCYCVCILKYEDGFFVLKQLEYRQ